MKNMCKVYFFLLAIVPLALQATVINVPADQATIQAGINAAIDGDTVLVAENTYFENINFKGKKITVASHFILDQDTSHISKTIIDGSQPTHPDSGSVIYMIADEDTTSVLMGFTITGGSGTFTTIQEQSATYDARIGGGVYIASEKGSRLRWNIIENNTISTTDIGYGGGLAAGEPPTSTFNIIENNTIRNNSVSGSFGYAQGGAIFFGSNGRIRENTISENTAHSPSIAAVGGAIRLICTEADYGPRFCLIENNLFQDNKAVSETGNSFGGAVMSAGIRITLRNNRIINNIAKGHKDYSGGGGLYIGSLLSGQHVIDGNLFQGNTLDEAYYGGGIALYNSTPHIVNNIFTKNSGRYGGAVFADENSHPELINNTLVKNDALYAGGGIYSRNSTLNVMNSIIWDNSAPEGMQIYRTGGSASITYSDIQAGGTANGNIETNPLFADSLFHLSDSSRCIGSGIESYNFSGTTLLAPASDFDGNPRPNPAGSFPDIGAQENERPTSTSIISVPYDYATIQAGINAAANGDTVLVAENTYFENINFIGKAITVASQFILDQDTSHISKTIIDGSQPSDPNKGSVVSFTSGEDTTSVLCGFTITGGTGLYTSGVGRQGGGIVGRHGGAKICNNIIENNSVVSGTYQAIGGGICFFPNRAVVENNIIRNNLSKSGDWYAFGGGIFFQCAGRIASNTITNNEVSYTGSNYSALGGGISSYETDEYIFISIKNNKILNNKNNSTTWALGGGLSLFYTNTSLTGNTVSGNRSKGNLNRGCGMFIQKSKNSTITDNTFSFNKTEGDLYSEGGGLCLYNTNGLLIHGNQFEENKSFNGGGLFEVWSENTMISENEFMKNSALSGGGMMIVESKNTTIAENKILQNSITDNNGGGLSIQDSPDTKLIKNLIKGNTALSSSGGGLEIVTTQPDSIYKTWLINNTICENSAVRGGGLFSEFAYLTIENTIFWDDSADTNSEIFYAGNSLNISYCDVQDSLWPGTVNIREDPSFVDSLCYLDGGSPCIDAGNPDPAYYDENGSRNDIGVYGGITDSLISTITGLFEIVSKHHLPDEFVLLQNYPNPFNPTTTIEFHIPCSRFVELSIYNILGQKVATLVSEKLLPGQYKYVWDASGLASGIYLYKLQTERGYSQTNKLILLK